MDDIQLKKQSTGEVELKAFGLNLNVNPRHLIRMCLNASSESMLNNMIEERFRYALKEFELWHEDTFSDILDRDKEEKLIEKYKHQEHVESIQDLADIIRHLIPLHSDGEVDLSESEKELSEIAYSFWKYNNFYGFKETKEIAL